MLYIQINGPSVLPPLPSPFRRALFPAGRAILLRLPETLCNA